MNNSALIRYIDKRLDNLLHSQHHRTEHYTDEAIFERGQIAALKDVYLGITGVEWEPVVLT